MSRRRNLLAAIGGVALVTPAVSALPSQPRTGKAERLWQSVPALEATYYEAQDAMVPGMPKAEWKALFEVSEEAGTALCEIGMEVLDTPPETVRDALLILSLGIALAYGAADCDMNCDATSANHRNYARATRRAADFLAAQHGHDLSAMLGRFHALPEDVA